MNLRKFFVLNKRVLNVTNEIIRTIIQHTEWLNLRRKQNILASDDEYLEIQILSIYGTDDSYDLMAIVRV